LTNDTATWAAEAVVSTTRGERVSTAADYRSTVDREAIARRQRRRQVEEALDEEREREAALAERLEDVVAEDGAATIDEAAFARMQEADVAIVRELLQPPSPFDEDEGEDLDAFFTAGDGDEPEPGLEEEVARLRDEIADSQRRQLAYRRYLEAVDSLGAASGESG
jgi:hypothetical protein